MRVNSFLRGKGEQGHHLPGQGDRYVQVARQCRKQSDDQKLGGDDDERRNGHDQDLQACA